MLRIFPNREILLSFISPLPRVYSLLLTPYPLPLTPRLPLFTPYLSFIVFYPFLSVLLFFTVDLEFWLFSK